MQLDLGSLRTYHPKGGKMIKKKQTTGARIMCTVLLGVLSNGFKLPIYFVAKSGEKNSNPRRAQTLHYFPEQY